MDWIVYILKLSDSSLYTGITNNLSSRLSTHFSGKGSKYVRSRLPFKLVYIERTNNRSEASKREHQIKKMKRNKKQDLVKGGKQMSFPIQPLYDQVFIKKDSEEKTKDGLYLPQSVKGRAVTGKVVAVGPGLLSPMTGGYLPMQLKVGDTVYVKEFSGYIVKYEEHEVHVMKEQDIVGRVLKEDEK